MERTHRWAERSLEAFRASQGKFPQALYGIVQGSVFEDLRKQSAEFIGKMEFDGLAIGGVAVGEGKKEMTQAVEWAVPLLPQEKIRHLLGVGDIDDIFTIIERGIDTFDCVTPTRLGRVGQVFVSKPEGNMKNRFRVDITKGEFAKDQGPLTKGCDCYACSAFTRGYINHLFRARELLGYHLATYHNVYFILNLVKKIREAIQESQFEKLKTTWLE
jgi:queuine tRNA-ribosyltransferase/7-cyano-7-deazaguanine tRNA-ribosyltransferase